MEITDVRVFPVNEDKLKAYVTIVFDRCFMVSDIKVICGQSGLFISMPSKRRKNGTFRDVAHPLNAETRHMIEEKVLAKYEEVLSDTAAERRVRRPREIGEVEPAEAGMAAPAVSQPPASGGQRPGLPGI